MRSHSEEGAHLVAVAAVEALGAHTAVHHGRLAAAVRVRLDQPNEALVIPPLAPGILLAARECRVLLSTQASTEYLGEQRHVRLVEQTARARTMWLTNMAAWEMAL